MTLFDELIDLLDLVGSRDCILGPQIKRCGDEACEPCTARELLARMTEAKERVAPQDDAVRVAPLDQALATSLPGTWVAVNPDGDLRRVVPKGPQGQYTLAMLHEEPAPEVPGQLDLGVTP